MRIWSRGEGEGGDSSEVGQSERKWKEEGREELSLPFLDSTTSLELKLLFKGGKG